MAEVIVIQGNQAVQQEKPKLRVCAYARVSSKSDEQQYSFFGQVQYYTRLINDNPEWEYVDIYADEGLTGTRKDKRDEFNRMLDDCREGKIDKILTKAVSRFARNISECVEVVKELKELGVTVYFEEQQLDSGRPSDFTAICVYATIAQEESISIAHNLRMSCTARMKLGTYKQVNAPYGYYIENDEFKINEEQAQVVRVIFRAYIEGKSLYKIADELNQAGVPTKFGGVTWRIKDISYILSNVRYKGDALLQKSYRDGFPYKAKKNRGEKDKYYKYNANVPIVSREEFDKAVKLLSKRRELYYAGRTTQEHSFSHMIVCRECGGIYRKKDRWDGKYAWVCRQHDYGADKCPSKPVDDTLQDDRHLSNFAIKINSATRQESFYPLYDNGRSLFYQDTEEMIEKACQNSAEYCTTFGTEDSYYDHITDILSAEPEAIGLIDLSVTEEELYQIMKESRLKGKKLDGTVKWVSNGIKCIQDLAIDLKQRMSNDGMFGIS